MIPDFMPFRRDRAQRVIVFLQRCILTDHEKRNPELSLRQEIQHARNEDVQVGRETFPARIAVGLQVRPLVIDVQRKAIPIR